LAAEFDRIHSVERARDVGSLREIFEPRDLRGRLIASLRSALDSRRPPGAGKDSGSGAGGKDGSE